METVKHWTSASVDDLAFRIGFDFVAQLETKLEEEGIDRKEFAQKAHVGLSRVSQVFNAPNNLRVSSLVQYAGAINMKVAIIVYDDGDPSNERGPITPEVFRECWQRAGCPADMFTLRSPTKVLKQDLRFYRSAKPGSMMGTNAIRGAMVDPSQAFQVAEQSIRVYQRADKVEQNYV